MSAPNPARAEGVPSLHDLLFDRAGGLPRRRSGLSAEEVIDAPLIAAFGEFPLDTVKPVVPVLFELIGEAVSFDGVVGNDQVAMGRYFGKCLVSLAMARQSHHDHDRFEVAMATEANPSCTFVGIDEIAAEVEARLGYQHPHFAAIEIRLSRIVETALEMLAIFSDKVALTDGYIVPNYFAGEIRIPLRPPAGAA